MATDEAVNNELEEKLKSGVMPEDFDIVVVNMDRVLFEGRAQSMIAPGPFGNFAILPGHTPLFIKLISGKLVINQNGHDQEIDISGGIARINQYSIKVLVDFEKSL